MSTSATIAEVEARGAEIKTAATEMKSILAGTGTVEIGASTKFADLPNKLRTVLRTYDRLNDALEATAVLGAKLCTLNVRINAGEKAYIPTSAQAAALLEGAALTIRIGKVSLDVPVTSLARNTFMTFSFLLGESDTQGRVALSLNKTALHGTNLCPAMVTRSDFGAGEFDIDLDLATSTPVSATVYGFRRFTGYSDPTLMDIIETIDEDGNVTSEDTMYFDAATSSLVSTSPLERGIPQYDETTGEITKWHVQDGHAERNDLYGVAADGVTAGDGVFPFNALAYKTYATTVETNAAGTTTATIENHMARIGVHTDGQADGFWMSNITTTYNLKTVASDGTVSTTSQPCQEVRFAATQLDASYVWIPMAEIGQYKVSRTNTYVDGTLKIAEYSAPTKQGFDNGARRDYHLERLVRSNDLEWTVGGETQDLSDKWWTGYLLADYSALAYLAWFEAGTLNVQSYIYGDCTGAPGGNTGKSRVNGVTVAMENAGVFFGVIGDPTSDASFRSLGIENRWGSTGTFIHDVTNVAGTFYWAEDITSLVNTFDSPESGETMTEYVTRLGYKKLAPVPNGGGYIKAMSAPTVDGETDARANLLIPTMNGGSATTYYCDNLWRGSAANTAYLVAFGYARGFGVALGAATISADGAWSLAVGYYWSARVTLRTK